MPLAPARWLTRALRAALKPYLDRLLDPARVMHNPYVSAKLLPLQPTRAGAVVRATKVPAPVTGPDGLPVPPRELWEGYGADEQGYLACGQEDMEAMLGVLRAAGADPIGLARVRTTTSIWCTAAPSSPISAIWPMHGCSSFAADFLYFSIGTEPGTQVFYDVDYLVRRWSPYVRVLSVTPEAYGYQTALLMQKP